MRRGQNLLPALQEVAISLKQKAHQLLQLVHLPPGRHLWGDSRQIHLEITLQTLPAGPVLYACKMGTDTMENKWIRHRSPADHQRIACGLL